MTLTIVPLTDPRIVPRYLLEQLKPLEFDIDEWYDHVSYAKAHGDMTDILLGFVDEYSIIKGVLWGNIDLLHKLIFVSFFTVDKEYWGNGELIERAGNYISDILERLRLKKALWSSTRSKAYEKYGFKPSKNILLEQDLEGWRNKDGRRRKQKSSSTKHSAINTGTATTNVPTRRSRKSRVSKR